MASRILVAEVKKIKILLFSEDPLESRWLKQMLGSLRSSQSGRHGLFCVNCTDRITAAVESLKRHHFDVVLVDLGMATGDDLQPLQKIDAAAPHVPMVAISGFNDESLTLKAIRFGAEECVFKDRLNSQRLGMAINLALERNRRSVDAPGNNCELQAAHNRIQRQAEQLQSYTAQLERINHDLEEFAYIASHDLKEPLRGIGSYCEILMEDYRHKLDCEGKRRLSTMMHLCDRLENLIDDLLAYCRVGHKARSKSRVNLNTVAANLLKMLRPAIERRNATVRIAGPLPSIVGNASLIAMVLSNLTLNGLKFNKKNRPCVEIGSLTAKPSIFYVKDNGIGIGKEHHEAIFTIFRRLHSRKKYEGSGMGLTIVKKIIELHGGQIWLKSSPNVGTTFYFTLAPSKNHNPKSGSEHTLAPPHWGRHNRVSPLEKKRRKVDKEEKLPCGN